MEQPSHQASSKRKLDPKGVVGLIVIIGIVFVWVKVSSVANPRKATPAQPATTYNAGLQSGTVDNSTLVVNPADLRVFGEVKNTGAVDGKPSCSINARDASYTYSGVDVVSPNNPIKPGDSWDFAADVTVTKQGAQYVTVVEIACK